VASVLPISARHGDNVLDRSPRIPWYTQESILEYRDTVYIGSNRNLIDFRLPVQYVLRPHMAFRGFCGPIVSVVAKCGDAVMVLPARQTTRVKSIVELWDGGTSERDYAFAPMSVTLTLDDEIDVSRSAMLVHPRNVPPDGRAS